MACASACGSAWTTPSATGPSSIRRSAIGSNGLELLGEKAPDVHGFQLEAASLLGAGEEQQVVHEALHPVDLRGDQCLDAADVFRADVVRARQHLELAADHGERRSQLVRGVGHELALPREGVVEAVEHVVERLRERADLLARPAGADAVG